MKKRIALYMCVLSLYLFPAYADEGDPLLSVDDLAKVQESYEVFLDQLEDLLVEKGLLDEEDREEWMMYQLGDFVQNGGYGMIAAMYTPDLLDYAREEDTMLRLRVQKAEYTLQLDTMRRYTPLDTTLPGLLLEASVSDENGQPVTCRLRMSASQGGFSAYDALSRRYQNVGVSIVNDGRACYWSDQPITDETSAPDVLIFIEALDITDDSSVLFSALLTLTPSGTGWMLADGALT